MSIFSRLFETIQGRNNIDINESSSVDIDRSLYNTNDNYTPYHEVLSLSQHNVWSLISSLRNINDNYKYKYAEYDAMTDEVVIQSALELYADDATQLNSINNKTVTVLSEDKDLQQDLEAFLESLNIDSRIWNWAYNIAQYGDMFLELHEDEDGRLSIEEVSDPSEVMDLYERGSRVAFAKDDSAIQNYKVHNKSNPQGLDLILYNQYKFVHFMINMSSKYDILEIPEIDKVDDQGDTLVRKFTVVRGVSMIEGVRSIYRILALLEDTLLAARVSKAEFIRVFNIEVGDATAARTTDIVNSVKNLFDSKASFDVNSGRYISNKVYRPIGDPIFNPTRDGKGSLNTENIGGDFQVRDIVDLDYFKDKLFSGLKIPKAYLGYEESLPGGLGDNTLSRLDIRYSKSVRRVQSALINGITDLCKSWLAVNGRLDEDLEFTISMATPSSAEELSRLSEISMKFDTISNMMGTISSNIGEYANIPRMYKILFDSLINDPKLKSDLSEELSNAIKKYDKEHGVPDDSDDESQDDSDDNIDTNKDTEELYEN